MKKRQMLFVPDLNPSSFVFFYEKGETGLSWSIRDYSVEGAVKLYRPKQLRWKTADEVRASAQHELPAPRVGTDNLAFWYAHTRSCNSQLPGVVQAEVNPTAAPPATVPSPVPGLRLPAVSAPPPAPPGKLKQLAGALVLAVLGLFLAPVLLLLALGLGPKGGSSRPPS
jgi:hypothetical protein